MQLLNNLAESQRALQEQVRVQSEWMRAEAEGRAQRSVVDTKALGMPTNFSGKKDEWPGWAYKFATWFGSQFDQGTATRPAKRVSQTKGWNFKRRPLPISSGRRRNSSLCWYPS